MALAMALPVKLIIVEFSRGKSGAVVVRYYGPGLPRRHHALAPAIAADHRPDRVRRDAIAYGWIDREHDTAFIESLGDPAEFKAALGRIHPFRRTVDGGGGFS